MDRQSIENIWIEALALIRAQVNDGTFKIWFDNTLGLDFTGNEFVVGVPSEFAKDWIENRFLALMTDAVSEVVGGNVACRLSVSPELAARLEEQNAGGPAEPAGDHGAGSATQAGEAAQPSRDASTGSPPRSFRVAGRPHRQPAIAAPSRAQELGLNEKYTFESFVMGPSNRFAHAAALAAAEMPGTSYNPLFIYGGVGLGKTHLLQAIGHYVLRHSPHLRVCFITIETFTNEFINSLRDETIEGFKRRYRSNDVLLIDDIQFLENKEQTQEEFFHTFNTLYEAGKQIVISSDRSPKGLVSLEDRLVSRFEWGLTTDVQPPDLETRIAILRKKVLTDHVQLTDEDVLTHIASRVPTNIRELEGCLTRVVAFASFNNRPIDVVLAREVLKDIPEVAGTRVTVELILGVVSSTLGVSIAEIKGDRRTRSVVQARHLAMYLARELTDASLPKIGDRLGGRDHTTVLHAVDKVGTLMKKDREIYNMVQQLTTRIKSAR
ncbi:MAG: chromosomal replication initiator protein DnaA [Thermoleophilia bacterium]